MQLALLLSSLLALLASNVSATALTYKLAANEKQCFFAKTEQQAAKIAFYFAVCSSALSAALQIPSK